MNANIPKLMNQIGLPELATMTTPEAVEHLVPAAVAGFADGDVVIRSIGEPRTGRAAELYGATDYNDGMLAQKLAAAAAVNGPNDLTDIYALQSMMSAVIDLPDTSYRLPDNQSTVRVMENLLVAEGTPTLLDKPAGVVLELGACLTSRSFIRDQLKILSAGGSTFRYIPITNRHFTNKVLLQSYRRLGLGDDGAEIALNSRLYLGSEVGVDAATAAMVTGMKAQGASTEIADIILAINGQHVPAADMEVGVKRSAELMRGGGALVLRGLVSPRGQEYGIEEMRSWAEDSGLDLAKARRIKGIISSSVAAIHDVHGAGRNTETVIVYKD